MPILESILWGGGVGAIAIFAAGIRRLPWRHAAIVGVGTAVVFAALRLATLDPTFDPAMLVLFGALGGSIATHGSVVGEQARIRRSEAILAGRPSSTV